jgi:hypothetical protein
MYQILENVRLMTKEEIDAEFNGRWVYIVKANITKHGDLIEGLPVVIADHPFEGNDAGIYDQYDSIEYEERVDYDLNHYEPFIPSVFSVEFVR